MEIYFNIKVLSGVLFSILFTLSLCMIHYSLNRKTYPGFSEWVAGMILGTIAIFLINLRNIVPDFFTIIVANGIGITSYFLFYLGFKLFAEEKVNILSHSIFITLYSLVVFPFFTYLYNNVNARIVIVSFASGIYLLLSACTLVRSFRERLNELNKLLLITLLLLIAIRFFRGALFLFPSHHIDNYMTAGPYLGFITLLVSVLCISLAIGMMQLNTENLEKEHQEAIANLQHALSEIQTLRGILPICSHCKNIRDDKGHWDKIENYIEKHSKAEFSHSICRECADKYHPDLKLYDT